MAVITEFSLAEERTRRWKTASRILPSPPRYQRLLGSPGHKAALCVGEINYGANSRRIVTVFCQHKDNDSGFVGFRETKKSFHKY